jgi:phytoene dehydrogenase-like protein
VEGGSDRLVVAMLDELRALGGRVETGHWVDDLRTLPTSRAVLLDLSPRQVLALDGTDLARRYRAALARFRQGPGICKVDWALSGPVPWAAAACRAAGTVHVGGTFAEVAASEDDVAAGRHPERPYVIVVQAGVVDPSRAPAGQQTLWGYCHVPSGSNVDMTDRIERQIERFAPGFGDLVLARSTSTAVDTERHNPNYVGGDIGGGTPDLRQTLFRPTPTWNPYRVPGAGARRPGSGREGPGPRLYLCSASTPPGGGVHGMCGMWAARAALADLGVPTPASRAAVS